jgi:hypothetical protein
VGALSTSASTTTQVCPQRDPPPVVVSILFSFTLTYRNPAHSPLPPSPARIHLPRDTRDTQPHRLPASQSSL